MPLLSHCCDARPLYDFGGIDDALICSKCKEHSGFEDEDQWEMLEARPDFTAEQQVVINAIIIEAEFIEEGGQE